MGRTATFTLFDANGVNIDAVTATVQGDQPQTLESHGATERSPYPIYEVVVAKGITEIIEHRRMEPIFYITDDPDIKRRLGVRP